MNRVGDRFFDQTVESGHQERVSDLDLFADLGVKALRYPVVWERVAPDAPDLLDWRWTDERLGRLRELGVAPIAGLVHHGSGPRYANIAEPAFAVGLAAFARAAAARYAWVRDWTPVNEPLTTARFCALYGHWHPHLADERAFWTTLLNEIDGVRLAMREIRKIRSDARLVQTEDLGRTYATKTLAYQVEYENARRWMTWDLLAGRVVPGHVFWEHLDGVGLGDRLRAIADDPCPADVLGVNHYLTSYRFLDHRLELYPEHTHGGNNVGAYADVEAVRVLQPSPGGMEVVLSEAWARYGKTLAVAESHNGCTREEQMRWFRETWDTASALRRRGVDMEAVTAWSLLGAFDWNSLLTRRIGHYESGVFDLRGGAPRPTALAGLLRDLAAGRAPQHPAAAGEGWWRRDVRLEYRPVSDQATTAGPRLERVHSAAASCRPVLITGATGVLGQAFARACEVRGLEYVLTGRAQLCLETPATCDRALDLWRPWAVVNAAGWARVEAAERDPTACLAVNRDGAAALSAACRARDLPLLSLSSDQVFDGRLGRSVTESDQPNPLNAYGRSKTEMERALLGSGGRDLIVRTAAVFAPCNAADFAAGVVRRLSKGRSGSAVVDVVVSPTYVPDLVSAALDLMIDGETGLWHLANRGALSWYDFAAAIAEALGFDPGLVRPIPAKKANWTAKRPAYAPLSSERGSVLPPLDEAIARYAAALREGELGEAHPDRKVKAAAA